MSIYGMDPSKNCLFWDANRKTAIRCGVSCGCVKQTEDLSEIDDYLGLYYEVENKNVEISEITDKEYNIYSTMRYAKYQAEVEKKEREERLQSLFGSGKKDRRSQ